SRSQDEGSRVTFLVADRVDRVGTKARTRIDDRLRPNEFSLLGRQFFAYKFSTFLRLHDGFRSTIGGRGGSGVQMYQAQFIGGAPSPVKSTRHATYAI